MNKELSDRVWKILPKEFKEEVKKYYRTLHEQYKDYDGLHFENAKVKVQERVVTLEYFFGRHNLTSDAEEEDEMLYVSRKQIDALQGEIFKAIMDAHDTDDWQDAAHYILDVMPRSFAALFGAKCLPDEEPKPAEPKFHKGDKFRYKKNPGEVYIVDHITNDGKVYYWDKDTDGMSKACIVNPDYIEPYTEPSNEYSATLRAESVKEVRIADEESHLRNLSQETANCDKRFDHILKDSFSKERRLNIAAMLATGMLANDYNFYPIDRALELADALIAEAGKETRNEQD